MQFQTGLIFEQKGKRPMFDKYWWPVKTCGALEDKEPTCFCALCAKWWIRILLQMTRGGESLRETFFFGSRHFFTGVCSQTDRQRDRPVNRSQQWLCKLLRPNEKGQHFAKRVGHKPSLTLRCTEHTAVENCAAQKTAPVCFLVDMLFLWKSGHL